MKAFSHSWKSENLYGGISKKDEGGRMKQGLKHKVGTLVEERQASTRHWKIFHFILHPSSLILGFHPSSFILCLFALTLVLDFSAGAQTQRRIGAHSSPPRDAFTKADEALVQRAVNITCSERVRDPFSSMPIDQMQARPSLAINNPDAVAGAKRAERLLPIAKRFVARAILKLARDYDLYSNPVYRSRFDVATARVQSVRRIKPDVDARDNASVWLRDPHTIEFGTIFLAGLRSDEGMVSVLAHELTHIADGQSDSLRPLFRAVARRAEVRTGFSITGQRAEELVCDLVGLFAAHEFVKGNVSWEPLGRRLARAVEHNCVDDDTSDEEHLSPRNTIRALFALDLNFAGEITGADKSGPVTKPVSSGLRNPMSAAGS